jgi:hypothetical protein
MIKVRLTGTGSCKLRMRGMDELEEWGVLGELDGQLNAGAVLTAPQVYYFNLSIGNLHQRIVPRVTDLTGSPTINAWIAPAYERKGVVS